MDWIGLDWIFRFYFKNTLKVQRENKDLSSSSKTEYKNPLVLANFKNPITRSQKSSIKSEKIFAQTKLIVSFSFE